MIDIINLLWIVPFCLGIGFVFAEIIGSWNRKCGEIRQVEKETEETVRPEDGEELNPMRLRNGFGVTKDKNPTFAEQWVNIMNYSGENQKEEDYEENERDYPEGNME